MYIYRDSRINVISLAFKLFHSICSYLCKSPFLSNIICKKISSNLNLHKYLAFKNLVNC